MPTPAGLEAWTPTDHDIDNTQQITLGVRLHVPGAVAIEIGGVAYWAPATTGGTYTWSMWTTTSDDDPNGDGTGTLIDSDSAAAAALVADDWNYLDLPLTLQPDVVYTAAVHTSLGRFVREANAYQSAGYTGQGIELLQAGSDPNPPGHGSLVNGVFLDGASGYPDTQFNFANYGITVWLPDAAEEVTGALAAATTAPIAVFTGVETFAGALGAVPPLPTSALEGVETFTGALGAFPPLPTCAMAGLVAVPVDALLVATTTPPTSTLAGTTPVVERPASWEPLLDMVRTAKRNAGVLVPAVACPRCGTPFEHARGVRHCPFDGSIY